MAIAMVGSLVAGCGGTSTENEGGNDASQTEQAQTDAAATKSEAADSGDAESTSAAAEGDTLVVEIWSGDASKEAVMTELFNNYNETTGKEQGIEIQLTVSSEVGNLLQLAQENNELPLLTDSIGELTYEEGGWAYPLAKMPGGQEFLDEWESKTSEYGEWSKLEGSDDIYKPIYSVGGPALFYNKEMFVEAGIVDENGEAKPPTTWSELLECAEKLTNGTTYGLALPMQWSGYAEYDILFPGANAIEAGAFTVDWDNQTFTFNLTEPIETIAAIYQNGYCVPGAETIDNDPARSYFSEGVAGMFLGYSWDIGVFTTQYVADFDWGLCELSADDGSNYGVMCSMGYNFLPTSAVAELSEADQEKVMSLIEWLWGDEVGKAYVEAGLIFPANADFIELADESLVSEQTYNLMEYLAAGRIDGDVWDAWETIRNNVDYEGAGAGYLCAQIIRLSQGEITMDDFTTEANSTFTEALKLAIENGELDPEVYK